MTPCETARLAYNISNVVLNVTLISIFIGIFFFTYAKVVEQNIVKNQSELIAGYLAKDVSTFLSKQTAQKIKESVTIPLDMAQQDREIEYNNQSLQMNAFIVLVIIFVVGIVIVFSLSKYYQFGLSNILIQNLIIVTFIGLTEFSFLTYIIQNFLPLDPNFVRYKILTSLKKTLADEKIDTSTTLNGINLPQIIT